MKRRWFQIHLSTALVIMLVAGGFLGLNLVQRSHYVGWVEFLYKGWPIDTDVTVKFRNPKLYEDWKTYSYAEKKAIWETSEFRRYSVEWNRINGDNYPELPLPRLLGNVGFALAALAGVFFLMEWRMRRKFNDA